MTGLVGPVGGEPTGTPGRSAGARPEAASGHHLHGACAWPTGTPGVPFTGVHIQGTHLDPLALAIADVSPASSPRPGRPCCLPLRSRHTSQRQSRSTLAPGVGLFLLSGPGPCLCFRQDICTLSVPQSPSIGSSSRVPPLIGLAFWAPTVRTSTGHSCAFW